MITNEELFKQLWDHIESGEMFILTIYKESDAYSVSIPLLDMFWLELKVEFNSLYSFKYKKYDTAIESPFQSLPDPNMKYSLEELKAIKLLQGG